MFFATCVSIIYCHRVGDNNRTLSLSMLTYQSSQLVFVVARDDFFFIDEDLYFFATNIVIVHIDINWSEIRFTD